MTGHPTENVPTCLQKPPHTSHQLKRKGQKLEKDGNFPLEHTLFTHRPKSQEERIKRTDQTQRSQKAGRKTKKPSNSPERKNTWQQHEAFPCIPSSLMPGREERSDSRASGFALCQKDIRTHAKKSWRLQAATIPIFEKNTNQINTPDSRYPPRSCCRENQQTPLPNWR